MTTTDAPPIACTLAPGEFKNRLAWIGALARDALRSHERRDLVLDLRYEPEARDRVREMVRNEQTCCSFLTFDLREEPGEIRLLITAPESAREAANMLFDQFVSVTSRPDDASRAPRGQIGTKAAGVTAATLATGAVACGACCVLPFALPATVLASTGSVLAWLAGAHVWVTGLAILVVVGAWGWVAWQAVRTRRKLARSTFYLMVGATALMAIAVLWPLVEVQLVRLLTT